MTFRSNIKVSRATEFNSPDDWIQAYAQCFFDYLQIDNPLFDLLDENQLPKGTPPTVPFVYATSERAYAQKIHEVESGNQTVKKQTLPLPIMAMVFQDAAFDPERYSKGKFRKHRYATDANSVRQLSWPNPYKLSFRLELRTRFHKTFWAISHKINQGLDHGAVYIPVPLDHYGLELHRWEIDGPTDNSDLDPGDNADRQLRYSWTVSVNGWIVTDPTWVPTARVFLLDVYNADLTESLESLVIERG